MRSKSDCSSVLGVAAVLRKGNAEFKTAEKAKGNEASVFHEKPWLFTYIKEM